MTELASKIRIRESVKGNVSKIINLLADIEIGTGDIYASRERREILAATERNNASIHCEVLGLINDKEVPAHELKITEFEEKLVEAKIMCFTNRSIRKAAM